MTKNVQFYYDHNGGISIFCNNIYTVTSVQEHFSFVTREFSAAVFSSLPSSFPILF